MKIKEYQEQLRDEFDRQLENLMRKRVAQNASLSTDEFMNHIDPLREQISHIAAPDKKDHKGQIPLLLVIKRALVSAETAMACIEIKGQQGHVNMTPYTPDDFAPLEGLQIPQAMAYLLIDIDTGQETLNVTPHDALQKLHEKKRSPLTIDEGIALVTHFPEVLTDKKTYNCFSMAGSRRDDPRVPALWISYKRPRLGWCWDNNPHTWLGTASCSSRTALNFAQ